MKIRIVARTIIDVKPEEWCPGRDITPKDVVFWMQEVLNKDADALKKIIDQNTLSVEVQIVKPGE